MSDDLVAELTLRLINETNAGIEEIHGELSEFASSAEASFEDIGVAIQANEAKLQELSQAFAGVGEGASEAINSIDGIGASIDADISKAKELQAALTDVSGGGAGGGGNGGLNGAVGPGADDGSGGHGNFVDEAVAGAGGGVASRLGGSALSMMSEAFLGYIAFDVAKDAAQKYADYDWTLTHIAITDGLSGSAAAAEVEHLKSKLNDLALQTGTSSTDLADAYSFLVTTGMNRGLIDQMMPSLAETSTAYNQAPSDMVQALFTLNDNMGIGPDEMTEGLAVLAKAAKLSHFSVADFGAELPSIAGQLNLVGMTGLTGLAEAASQLEIIRKGEGTSGEAGTDYKDLLFYLHSPMGLRMFDMTARMEDLLGPAGRRILDEYHVHPLDLPDYLNTERAHGVDEIDAITDYFHQILAPISSPTDRADVVGDFLHNQGAQNAVLYLNEHYDQLSHMERTLKAVNPAIVDTDFQTASATPEIALRRLDESFNQLAREVGTVLIPAFDLLSDTMGGAAKGLGWLDRNASNSNPTNPHEPHFGPAFQPHPITINVHVDKSGNVTAAPAPGVSVKVNQGRVLGTH